MSSLKSLLIAFISPSLVAPSVWSNTNQGTKENFSLSRRVNQPRAELPPLSPSSCSFLPSPCSCSCLLTTHPHQSQHSKTSPFSHLRTFEALRFQLDLSFSFSSAFCAWDLVSPNPSPLALLPTPAYFFHLCLSQSFPLSILPTTSATPSPKSSFHPPYAPLSPLHIAHPSPLTSRYSTTTWHLLK